MTSEEKNPIEQLIELFVYAPVGLVYEYPEVLETLVKRGKSQVQLAKVLGQMAAKQGQGTVDTAAGDLWHVIARGITEVGTLVGLAPDGDASASEAPTPAKPPSAAPSSPAVVATTDQAASTTAAPKAPASKKPAPKKPAPKKKAAEPTASASADELPIAGYTELRAKEVIPLLADLDADQRARIETYERANRSRKTILAQIAKLA